MKRSELSGRISELITLFYEALSFTISDEVKTPDFQAHAIATNKVRVQLLENVISKILTLIEDLASIFYIDTPSNPAVNSDDLSHENIQLTLFFLHNFRIDVSNLSDELQLSEENSRPLVFFHNLFKLPYPSEDIDKKDLDSLKKIMEEVNASNLEFKEREKSDREIAAYEANFYSEMIGEKIQNAIYPASPEEAYNLIGKDMLDIDEFSLPWCAPIIRLVFNAPKDFSCHEYPRSAAVSAAVELVDEQFDEFAEEAFGYRSIHVNFPNSRSKCAILPVGFIRLNVSDDDRECELIAAGDAVCRFCASVFNYIRMLASAIVLSPFE